METERIDLYTYLKDLNKGLEAYNKYHFEIINVNVLTCKKIANLANVTQATISNLNQDSKTSLLIEISQIIYDEYFILFEKTKPEYSMINILQDLYFNNLPYYLI